MLRQLRPTHAYLRVSEQIPDEFVGYVLVLIHYHDESFHCDRWTTRTRDILRKRAKMLQFDECSAHLFKKSRLDAFESTVLKNAYSSMPFLFPSYRFCGNKWILTIDEFCYNHISSIEYYLDRGEFSELSHWKMPKSYKRSNPLV